MNTIKCQVCGCELDLSSSTICKNCGFEHRLNISSELPEAIAQFDEERLRTAKKLYDELISAKQGIESLKTEKNNLSEEVERMKARVKEQATAIEELSNVKHDVPFYLMKVDINRTYQLFPINEGLTSFGNFVHNPEINCTNHFCIDPNTDPTLFVINCKKMENSTYELTLKIIGNKIARLNRNVIKKEERIISPDSIELDNYSFILLRP